MRKFIVGLGNPGEQYEFTRHNVGLLFIDFLIGGSSDILSTQKKFKNSNIYAYNENVILMKSLEFMNRSGKMVRELVKWCDIHVAEELIIVHDDLDITLGSFKFQREKSPRDHKGIISVENFLHTKDFQRLRIGIENRNNRDVSGEKYVLEDFRQGELDILEQVFHNIVEKDILAICL